MKPTNSTLNAILASPEFIVADAYTFYLNDGTVLRYTSGDTDITYNGNTYSSGNLYDNSGNPTGIIFNGGGGTSLSWKTGLEVDTLMFDISARGEKMEGYDWFTAIRLGLFDSGQFSLGRFYMTIYGDTSAGLLKIFDGMIGSIDAVRTKITFNIDGFTTVLNQPFPRNVYQASCLNTLYDSACTINQASYMVNGIVSSGSTGGVINSNLTNATGYFDLGKMKFTSGVNSGLWRSIKSYTNGSPSVLNINVPLYTPPANGDTFIIYPGCDRTMPTCTNKFSNLANFRGQPFIPENSTAV
jgi:uncharacterized phage protein (TIGR02218 family)